MRWLEVAKIVSCVAALWCQCQLGGPSVDSQPEAAAEEFAPLSAPLPKPTAEDRETTWTKWLAQQHALDDRVILPDGRQPDLVDHEKKIAWEVEWVSKWEESFGQSVGYASALDYEPGIWLLYKRGDDEEWNQAQAAAEYLQGRGVPLHVRTEIAR